ncbi:hypothetical protein BDB00DRAFT_787030 [Zychaea mexicana]|uniref:uncharacterized protein n=1 Tax=Zychaea mexicana TaxID=64656 RepID=UPI0022FE31B8|nr:uncharacterized protein BDB00DRAFT_787030 [Zychaea mexicana]KAI9494683.1 hypothetical protein BDB00DRAFT_787030 [Zychaea mexicana]
MSESNEDRDQDHRNNVRQQPESSFRSTQTAAVTAAAVTATRRASTYKLLSEELSEAQERIKAGSQDPNNYVLVGRLFSYQGNQQEAISVLEQGLRAVPADHQLVIQQQIDAAKTRLDRRIDFIAQCPYELVCNIAIYMETKTAIRCLFVSRSWRYKLLSCKELWRYVTLNGSGKMTMVRQTLFAVSEHIGTLYIHAQPGKIHRHLNALKAMASGNVDFASLEALIIQDNGM